MLFVCENISRKKFVYSSFLCSRKNFLASLGKFFRKVISETEEHCESFDRSFRFSGRRPRFHWGTRPDGQNRQGKTGQRPAPRPSGIFENQSGHQKETRQQIAVQGETGGGRQMPGQNPDGMRPSRLSSYRSRGRRRL